MKTFTKLAVAVVAMAIVAAYTLSYQGADPRPAQPVRVCEPVWCK